MALLEKCIERTTALAAACGWLAFGGGTEAVVGIIMGGAGLGAAISDAMRRHGPESAAALKAIRKRVSEDLTAAATAERWEVSADLRAADDALERALASCFLDRRSLAAAARTSDGFPVAATRLIYSELAKREPDVFGSRGPEVARTYAKTVIDAALCAIIENQSYFEALQPHLMMEALRGIGALEEKLEAVHSDVAKILQIVSRNFASPGNALEFDGVKLEAYINERGEMFLLHDRPFPYELTEVQLDLTTGLLHFVVAGGFKRDFGIPLADQMMKYVDRNSGRILIAQVDEAAGEIVAENSYPLALVSTS